MNIYLLFLLAPVGAVTLTGSSEYAVPGTEFTLTCDVPEEASLVTFYRSPDLTLSVISIQVGGGLCYNTKANPAVPCTADVCSCVTSGGNIGTVFRWIIQPQTGDQGSVWFCSRTNLNLPNPDLASDNYTLNMGAGPGNSIAFYPPHTTYTSTEGDTLPDITCTADCRPNCTFVWTRPDNTNFTVSPVLSLGQLDRSEHGTYRCSARNDVGESTKTISVIVQYKPFNVSLTPSTVTYTPTEGQTIPTITCSADCNPACTYSWTKDGQSYTTGSGLQLTNIQRGQTGVYRCTSSNVHGSDVSFNINVIVDYGPGTSIAMSPSNITYTRTEGDTLPDITCTADCRPDCTFVWTRPDNTNFTVSPVLSLGQLDKSEHGAYKCTARNDVGMSTINTSIIILYGPGTSLAMSPPATTYIRSEGDTLPDIICTAVCRPGCTFVWTRPDNTSFTVSPVLSLGQLDRSEHGTYICTARNTVGKSTITTIVTVQYGPGTSTALSPPDTTYTRTEGDTLPDITCTADCRPDCTFVWTRPDNTSFTLSPVLSLGQLNRSEHGTYRCTARNKAGESMITSNLNVQFPPNIVNLAYDALDGNLTEESKLSLVCSVESFPPPTIQWAYKANGTVLQISQDVLESTYTLTNAGCLDTGLYTCSVWNSVFTNEVTRNIPINVLCVPREDPRMDIDHIFGLSTSENLTVVAHFLANPAPYFRWGFQNTSIINETNLSNGTDNFQIYSSYFGTNMSAMSIGIRTNIQEHWYGIYAVTAINSQGSGRIRFTAKAQGKPNAPYEGAAICPFQDQAVVSWKSAFDGGSTQTFIIGRRSQTQKTYVIDGTTNFSDPGQHKTTNISISGLSTGTYYFTVYAVNQFGNSSFENEVNCTIKALPDSEAISLGPILGAAGGSVAAIIACIAVAAIIVTRRRYRKKNKDDDTEMITGECPTDSSDGLKPNILYESSDGLKANILYETSENLPGSSSEYAVVQKKSKSKAVSPNDVYAVVDKSKKEISEKKNEVEKPKRKGEKGGKGGKGGKGKHKKKETDKKGEDVYENVKRIGGTSDDVYANSVKETTPVSSKEPSRKMNKDGLIYLDIEFKEDMQNGRNFVIRGIENRTDYADVDFTKRTDPLPSDDEDTNQTADVEII